MDIYLQQKHPKCIIYTVKDSSTIFILTPSGQKHRTQKQSSQIELVEFDLVSQTVKNTCQCLLFEGVNHSDNNYKLLYSQTLQILMLIYPNMMICVYHDNNNCLDSSTSPLTLKNVYQSQHHIVHANFLQQNFVAVLSSSIAVLLPFEMIDLLATKSLQFLANQAKQARGLYLVQFPTKTQSFEPVDLIVCGPSRVMIPFSDGSIWEVDFKEQDNQQLIGVRYMQDFVGSEVQAQQVNTVDCMLVDEKRGHSIHSSQFQAQNPTEYVIFGDTRGSLVILKDKRPEFFDLQFSQHQIASLKWLSVFFQFAVITSDGVLKICQASLVRQTKDQPNRFKISKLASVQSFSELSRQIQIQSLNLRGSTLIATKTQDSQIESQCGYLQVLWPMKVLKKFNKKKPEDQKLVAETELQTYKYFPTLLPMIQRIGHCGSARNQQKIPILFQSSMLPRQFKDFVPNPDNSIDNIPSLQCESSCFFIDEAPSISPKNDVWIYSYDFASEQKKQLVNITKESGIYETDHFQVVRLDMRPVSLTASSSARFLVSLELQQVGEQGLICSFQMDLLTGKINQHVLQLAGRCGIYLGKLDYPDPSILILNHDFKSIMIFSLDQGELDSKLPRGDLHLASKVIGLFWTPLRDGLAVLYEMEHDNILTFSKNRIEKNEARDFGILISRNYGLKLSYDERVFDVKWTGFSSDFASPDRQIKGVVATNQRVYIVDDKMAVISMTKLNDPITGLQWMGDQTVLATTQKHILHITSGKHPLVGVVLSFTNVNSSYNTEAQKPDNNEQGILGWNNSCANPIKAQHGQNLSLNLSDDSSCQFTIVKALSDRVIISSKNDGKQADFLIKPIFMLESLLLGYLSSVCSYKLDLQLISYCLKYLDTNAISGQLQRKLSQLRLVHQLSFLQKSQPQQHKLIGGQQLSALCSNQSIEFDEFITILFPQKDLTKFSDRIEIIKKLAIDSSAFAQIQLLRRRAEYAFQKSGFLCEAYDCAELLGDLGLAIQILKKAGDIDPKTIGSLDKFLVVATNETQKGWSDFDFRTCLAGFQAPKQRQKKQPENQIKKLILGFDEVPFNYHSVKYSQKGQLIEHRLRQMQASSENISIFLGLQISSVIMAPQQELDQNLESQVQQIEKEANFNNLSFDDQEEVDEEKYLVAYWRCEDNNSIIIIDVSQNQINLKSDHIKWENERNLAGFPIELEDKWGKMCAANFSFNLPQTLSVAQSSHGKLGFFTFEGWIKFSNSRPKVTLLNVTHHFTLKIVGILIMFEEKGYQNDSKVIEMELQDWVHFAIVGNASKKSLSIYFYGSIENVLIEFYTKDQQFLHIGPDTSLLTATQDSQALATELRLWKVPLGLDQLRGIRKQPLAILFERKRQLNILINKKNTQENQDVQVKSKKKTGGLKFTSKFDQKKQEKEPVKEATHDNFGFFAAQEEPKQPQIDFFSFDNIKEKPLQQFDDFGSGQSAFENKTENGFADFGTFKIQQPVPQKDFASFDIFQSQTSYDEKPKQQQLSPMTEEPSKHDPFNFFTTKQEPNLFAFNDLKPFQSLLESIQPQQPCFEFNDQPIQERLLQSQQFPSPIFRNPEPFVLEKESQILFNPLFQNKEIKNRPSPQKKL